MIEWVLKEEILIIKEVLKLPSLLVLKTVRLCAGAFLCVFILCFDPYVLFGTCMCLTLGYSGMYFFFYYSLECMHIWHIMYKKGGEKLTD